MDALPPQAPPAFIKAVRDDTTSPPFIAITIINDVTGEHKSGCVTVNLVRGAIHKEYGLAYNPSSLKLVRDKLIAQDQERIYHFKNPKAWENMPASAWKAEACDIIKNGGVARMADMTGQVVSARK